MTINGRVFGAGRRGMRFTRTQSTTFGLWNLINTVACNLEVVVVVVGGGGGGEGKQVWAAAPTTTTTAATETAPSASRSGRGCRLSRRLACLAAQLRILQSTRGRPAAINYTCEQ